MGSNGPPPPGFNRGPWILPAGMKSTPLELPATCGTCNGCGAVEWAEGRCVYCGRPAAGYLTGQMRPMPLPKLPQGSEPVDFVWG